jgi:hypothetical protein
MQDRSKLASAALAATAVSLFIAGCAAGGGGGGGSASTTMADAGAVKVKCYGANACKGQNECKTAMNACKGQGSCKGHGFVMMTEKACVDHFGRA